MKEKIDAPRGLEPRSLSVSDIRLRVEEIAETVTEQLRPSQITDSIEGLDAFPLDNRRFIVLMSEFIRMN